MTTPARNTLVLAAAGLLALAIAAHALGATGPRQAALFAIALALGWTFIATGFGFTGAFRAWQLHGDGAPLAATLLVPAIAALVVIPVGHLVPGYGVALAPPGLSLILGAMLFGVGMQLANGCGSGTLAAAGAGSRRMWIVLPFFCAGGVLGSLLLPAAETLPALSPVGLGMVLGPWPGLAATIVLLAAMVLLLTGGTLPDPRAWRAPALIGVLAGLLFLAWGAPWGITMGLTLWGAKLAQWVGLPIAEAAFWTWDGPRDALAGSLLDDASSLADLGLLLGAALCAAARGDFHRPRWPDRRGAIAAVLGGVLMGVGARLAYGCNMGAFVGGAASGSLHGFLWFAAVLPGSWLGIRLRPWAFGQEGKRASGGKGPTAL